MADITISDLELAPALTDDMVLPVENTTDTYAATLAMLRRLINKTFVEVENADFNDLTDDGFYQCTGTPTNSPEAGAINWTLQVSAESGVVVQRAFSLDDGFENFYIRRFNGVMWKAWKNMTNVVETPFSLGDSRYFEVASYNTSWLASSGQYNSSFVYPSMWGQLQVELSNINVGEVGTYNGYLYTKRGLPVVLSSAAYTDYDFVVNQDDQTFRLPLKNGSETLIDYSTITPVSFPYTATEDGYVVIWNTDNDYNLIIQTTTGDSKTISIQRDDATGANYSSQLYPMSKGETISYTIVGSTGTLPNLSFCKTKGNGTLYYYVGDTVQDASLINAGAVLGQLSNKANIDAGNFNADGKSLLSGLGMPSNRYIDLTLGASGSTYTAPANGWVSIAKTANSDKAWMVISNSSDTIKFNIASFSSFEIALTIPVHKSESFKILYSGMRAETNKFCFVYAEGEN